MILQPEATGQRAKVLTVLRSGRLSGRKVPSYELAACSLQYGARILELRRMGFEIRNETVRLNGQVHGTFELLLEPGELQPSLPLVSHA